MEEVSGLGITFYGYFLIGKVLGIIMDQKLTEISCCLKVLGLDLRFLNRKTADKICADKP